MKKYVALTLLIFFTVATTNAQFRIRTRPGMRNRPRMMQQKRNIPKFQPVVNLSLGYGIPNLDRYQLLDFFNQYRGSISQTGPVFVSMDYQFNRSMSVGAMVSYGKVSAPYYNYNNSTLAFTGNLKNWSIMFNFIRYIPASEKISAYIRTAIGINLWEQDYLDPSGNKAVIADDPTSLAYQTGLGVKFKLSKQAGLFVEAGYGKYILSGGLSLKF